MNEATTTFRCLDCGKPVALPAAKAADAAFVQCADCVEWSQRLREAEYGERD